MRRIFAVLALVLFAQLSFSQAQPVTAQPALSAEAKTARYMESVRNQPLLLGAFLRQMPKGGDLHHHLTGSIYAETYVQWAAQRGLCADGNTLALSEPPCSDKQVAAATALKDPILYRRMIDTWSMRDWQWSGQSPHDHFFDAFPKFDPANRGWFGEMLAEVSERAANDHLQYIETMFSPDEGASIRLGAKVQWDDNFGRMRQKLLDSGVKQIVADTRKTLDAAGARRDELLRCKDSNPRLRHPGCGVQVRYIFQILRAFPREQVFAQILTAFELASVDSRVVALNPVMPEDWLIPMQDFSLHIRMISFLHELYPTVHLTLHAGELAPGVVPPEGLRSHIRESVERGHAERIGHGVDIMYEEDPFGLLEQMARRNIMAEICLTSNDMILGIKGAQHPLAIYMKYGVPVALATDDQGVARGDMTTEYIKGVQDQGLTYTQLKTMARTSLEHAFLPGDSFWQDGRKFVATKACSADRPSAKTLSAGCQELMTKSEKARVQWEFERALADFEGHIAANARAAEE